MLTEHMAERCWSIKVGGGSQRTVPWRAVSQQDTCSRAELPTGAGPGVPGQQPPSPARQSEEGSLPLRKGASTAHPALEASSQRHFPAP